MNIELREASTRLLGAGTRAGRNARHDSTNGFQSTKGFQRIVARASRRLAARRAHVLAEQETERLWFWQLVKLEVERTRRKDHSFSVLCVQGLDGVSTVGLARDLRPQLRETDAVLAERDRLLILLGETATHDARRAMRRLGQQSDLPLQGATWKEVAFPRDAITFGALVDCLLGPDQGVRLLLAG